MPAVKAALPDLSFVFRPSCPCVNDRQCEEQWGSRLTLLYTSGLHLRHLQPDREPKSPAAQFTSNPPLPGWGALDRHLVRSHQGVRSPLKRRDLHALSVRHEGDRRSFTSALLAASLERAAPEPGGGPGSTDRGRNRSRAQTYRDSASRNRRDPQTASTHVAEQDQEVSSPRISRGNQGCEEGTLGSLRPIRVGVSGSLREAETRRSDSALPDRLVSARAPLRSSVSGAGSVYLPSVGSTRRSILLLAPLGLLRRGVAFIRVLRCSRS